MSQVIDNSEKTVVVVQESVRVISVGSQGLQGIQGVAGANAPILPTGTLVVSPAVGSGFVSATLTWTSQNAVSASINQGIGTVPVNGSRSVNAVSTTTYTLTLTNANGTALLKTVLTLI